MLDPAQVDAVIAKLGPDPLTENGRATEDRFVATIRKKPTPIGLLLMDQSVVSGIGNVYRAELLFRARVNPHTPGKKVTEETARALWRDWAHLLKIGVETGQMLTMDDLDEEFNRLRGMDVVFTQEPTRMGPITLAVCSDTCGNLIQLYQPA